MTTERISAWVELLHDNDIRTVRDLAFMADTSKPERRREFSNLLSSMGLKYKHLFLEAIDDVVESHTQKTPAN